MFETLHKEIPEDRTAWWSEWELATVLLLGLLTFCVRLDALPLFGEEPRRALIAREMVESGDWLVPGTQGVFLPSRPPLQNWLIAVIGLFTGSFDVWEARTPSVVSTLAIAALIYGYLRQHVGKLGSSTGAVAFLTMTLVMEFGRSAETEAVFSLFVASSLILWHWGWDKKCPAWQIWSLGYFCAALGMLTKGLQAPLYFVAATWLYLVLTGNRRSIVTRGQVIGILVFVAVVGAWQGPFTWYRGLADSLSIYFEDVAGRFVDRNWSRFFEHLVVFPLELFCVRLMPWSILLLAYGNRRVRDSLRNQHDLVLFLSIGILFSFVSVWLPPGSKVRYFMPLFPCIAALIGVAIDRLAKLRDEIDSRDLWTNYVKLMSAVMLGTALFVVVVSTMQPNSRISLSIFGAVGFAAAVFFLRKVSTNALSDFSDRAMARSVFSIAAFLALVQVSLIVTVQQRRCEDIAGQIAQLKQHLPKGTKLVSLGPVHHAFAYFYRQPIPIVTCPTDEHNSDIDYFCLHTHECEPPQLPFEWTEVCVVSCDRLKGNLTPKERVFIGRRLVVEQAGISVNRGSID